MSLREKYTVVIGLEIHAQMLTRSKAFSGDSTEYGQLPNTNVSVVTLAHPGTLPTANLRHIEFALRMGLATGCQVTPHSVFARKNYFYPDLPKGYQISQDRTPLCRHGGLTIRLKDGSEKRIGITRIHMEEDAGKSLHLEGEEETLVDFNRTGVPLIEIVSEPDIRSPEEAAAYMQEIRRLVRYLDISDGNMEEGSFRCDVNVSVMPKNAEHFGNRAEIKNMNSFRNVQRAIEYEIDRQIEIVENGGTVDQETRNFNAEEGKTYGMRVKETLNDYRYFPEPDLQPIEVQDEWLQKVWQQMPPLPHELFEKFTQQLGLPEYDAGVLTDAKEIALYYNELTEHTSHYKAASNWVMGPVKSYLNELTLGMDAFPLETPKLAELIELVESRQVNHNTATQKIFPQLLQHPERSPRQIAEENNLLQTSDTGELSGIVEEILGQNPEKVAQYRNGKKNLMGMFMGQVMKKTQGKADPQVAQELLKEQLDA